MTKRKALALAARCRAVNCCPLGAADPSGPEMPIGCAIAVVNGLSDCEPVHIVAGLWDDDDPHAALEVCEQIGLLPAVERGLKVRERRVKGGVKA